MNEGNKERRWCVQYESAEEREVIKKKEIGHRNLTPSVGTAQSVLSHLPLKDRKKKGSRVRTRAGERVSSLFLLFSLRSFHSHSSLSLPSLSPSHSQLPSVSSSCLVSTGKHT